MFTELFPIVATTDLPRALGFYRALLGGVVGYEFAGPGMANPRTLPSTTARRISASG